MPDYDGTLGWRIPGRAGLRYDHGAIRTNP